MLEQIAVTVFSGLLVALLSLPLLALPHLYPNRFENGFKRIGAFFSSVGRGIKRVWKWCTGKPLKWLKRNEKPPDIKSERTTIIISKENLTQYYVDELPTIKNDYNIMVSKVNFTNRAKQEDKDEVKENTKRSDRLADPSDED
ncbi:hypothetical protein [Geomicrobium sp. JCM 19055]|uniref:hypothetical protein n=1 Tax=Geomicrobium sp. JCM 19055 TaxID=1460649 RepID=UPI0005A67895|nr:hypothetical protein [Geomicrobium sp. JCM 19055]